MCNLLSGFRKGYSTQHALQIVIENWKRYLDLKGILSTILMDLLKAYDCLPHDLLIARLEAYGIERKSLKLIYSYRSGRKQRVKVASHYSSYKQIKIAVPQGSVLGRLLFNISSIFSQIYVTLQTIADYMLVVILLNRSFQNLKMTLKRS